MNRLMLTIFALALVLAPACSPTTPELPADMSRAPDSSVGADLGAPDLVLAPAIVSVAPTSAKIGALTTLTIKGNGQANFSPEGIWDFGTCSINSYTYTPIDANSGKLELDLPANTPAGTCDLVHHRKDGAVLTLKAAFSIVP